MIRPQEVAKTYVEGLLRVKANHPHGWMVEQPDVKAYPPFLVQNGRAGFCVAKTQLVGVWSLGGGRLPRILNLARAVGAEWLSCYDAGLVALYEQSGCTVTGRAAFDPAFAPADWPGNVFPDYVTMRL